MTALFSTQFYHFMRGASQLSETRGKEILVVDDEPSIVDNIRFALEKEDFKVTTSGTGQEALDHIEEAKIDLVILDVGLPDCSGFDVCREIRKSSDVPIVFLTSRTEEVDRIVGLELGADDYVLKPFSPRELTARIKNILRRSTKQTQASENEDSNQEVGEFRIAAQSMKIFFMNQELELTRYEYRILEVLLKRPGWVYSRDQLMNMVWEEPDISFHRTVDTHIKTIRSKIRQISEASNPIKTHRGTGYSVQS